MADVYRVLMQPEAYEGMESAYEYISQESLEAAHRWANGLMETINSLHTFPLRCPLAPENAFFRQEIRHLLYGKGRHAYRVLFTVNNDVVSVLHIRHGAQEPIQP